MLTTELHRGQKIIALRFAYDKALIGQVKKLPDARWSQSKKSWYLPNDERHYEELTRTLGQYFEIINKSDKKETVAKAQPPKERPLPARKESDTALPEVIVEKDVGHARVFIRFKYDKASKTEVKRLDGSWWHTEAKVWSAYLNNWNIERIKEIFPPEKSNLIFREIAEPTKSKQKQKKAIDSSIVDEKFIVQLKLLNRAENTINNYKSTMAHFLHYFKGNDIASLPDEKIRDYILDHREQQGYSESYQRLMVSALKNYYAIVFNRELDSKEIPYPEKSRPLPKVISKEDMEKIIQLTINQKHKMILLMLYGLGLRRSELANLKVNNIDFNRNTITIFNAKGRKDRTLPIPKALSTPIKNYIRDFLPRDYFLIGLNGGKYSEGSILNVVKQAAVRAKVIMTISPHILRHCFATHSLEKGIDLRYIQAMLGHKSSKTTEIYTYVSTKQLNKLSNPLDDIKF